MRSGQNFANNVEHGVIVERVADFLELLQKALQDSSFDGVRRDKVKDQAILALPVTMNAPHALLEPIGIPWDIVVKEDVADLKIDALSCGLRRNEDLNFPIAKLLLREQPRAGLVSRTGFHPAMDETHAEPPRS